MTFQISRLVLISYESVWVRLSATLPLVTVLMLLPCYYHNIIKSNQIRASYGVSGLSWSIIYELHNNCRSLFTKFCLPSLNVFLKSINSYTISDCILLAGITHVLLFVLSETFKFNLRLANNISAYTVLKKKRISANVSSLRWYGFEDKRCLRLYCLCLSFNVKSKTYIKCLTPNPKVWAAGIMVSLRILRVA
jgi:hypothetical protein